MYTAHLVSINQPSWGAKEAADGMRCGARTPPETSCVGKFEVVQSGDPRSYCHIIEFTVRTKVTCVDPSRGAT